MDCCICSPIGHRETQFRAFRSTGNTICDQCLEGARRMIDFLKEIDGGDEREDMSSRSQHHEFRANTPSMGMSNALKRVKELKEKEEEMNNRLGFVHELLAALKDEIHTDILIKPKSGTSIPAHKAFLATRSEIFRTLLSSDECKSPAEGTISLPELTHEEIQSLLKFLYYGSLGLDDDKHINSLLIAADKYEIPFLKSYCESRILHSLGPSNALQVLEVANMCSNMNLKEKAMGSILKHAKDVIFSDAYNAFALKNAHLCVEITRALLTETKTRREETASPSSP